MYVHAIFASVLSGVCGTVLETNTAISLSYGSWVTRRRMSKILSNAILRKLRSLLLGLITKKVMAFLSFLPEVKMTQSIVYSRFIFVTFWQCCRPELVGLQPFVSRTGSPSYDISHIQYQVKTQVTKSQIKSWLTVLCTT